MPQITRKALDEMNAELERLRTIAALRWTTEVKPDVPPPGNLSDGHTTGYKCVPSRDYHQVELSWSESNRHGTGEFKQGDYMSGSRGCLSLYSTELLAWKACRAEMEMMFAKKLAAIDKKIAELETT